MTDLAIQFPVRAAGVGAHQTSVAPARLLSYEETLRDIVAALSKLDTKDRVNLLQAFRLVQLAHNSVREDFSLAYYLMASAIEVIASRAVPRSRVAIKHKEETVWAERAKTDPDFRTLLSAYKDERGKNSYLKKRFVEFVFQYCPPESWTNLEDVDAESEEFMAHIRETHLGLEEKALLATRAQRPSRRPMEVYPEDLSEPQIRELIQDVYEHRSKFTHEGAAPPRMLSGGGRFFESDLIFEDGQFTRRVLPTYRLISFIASWSINAYLRERAPIR